MVCWLCLAQLVLWYSTLVYCTMKCNLVLLYSIATCMIYFILQCVDKYDVCHSQSTMHINYNFYVCIKMCMLIVVLLYLSMVLLPISTDHVKVSSFDPKVKYAKIKPFKSIFLEAQILDNLIAWCLWLLLQKSVKCWLKYEHVWPLSVLLAYFRPKYCRAWCWPRRQDAVDD